MTIRIGMPQGLMHFQYGQVWENCLNRMGAELVLSGPLNAQVLADGNALEEVCLPAKAYFGQVCKLRREVDYIFCPRLISVKKQQYMCPKVIGMPDLLRANIDGLPPLIDVPVNMYTWSHSLYGAVISVGRLCGCDPGTSLLAWQRAWQSSRQSRSAYAVRTPGGVRVGVIGHPYMLQDEHLSLNLLAKLTRLGLTVITPDMVSERDIAGGCRQLNKALFWSNCQQLAGAAISLLCGPNPVDGILFFTCFSCGPDALVGEVVRQKAESANIPCMLLSVDEHTAQAGFITRIEAFSDMLRRKKH